MSKDIITPSFTITHEYARFYYAPFKQYCMTTCEGGKIIKKYFQYKNGVWTECETLEKNYCENCDSEIAVNQKLCYCCEKGL